MKTKISIILLLLCINYSCKSNEDNDSPTINDDNIILDLDFENNTVGFYTDQDLLNDIGSVDWKIIEDKATIEEDVVHGKVLKVKYPENGVGPNESGIQFVKSIPNTKEYYLDYYVKFATGFDFALGGKLPGLTSGGSTFTGGNRPENGEGWSARYMWQGSGAIILYFYYKDMISNYGDAVATNSNFNTGVWYRITQHLKMNTSDNFDGIMEVWINGSKVINNTDVRFRLAPLGKIDSFYFSTFHGGSTAEWAPNNDSYAYFDEFKITTNKPTGLE